MKIFVAFAALFFAFNAESQIAANMNNIAQPNVGARAFVLYDALSDEVLAQQASSDRFEPASLTKLMTAYLTFAALKEKKLTLTQTLPVSEHAWRAEGSRMFIDPKQKPLVEDLIRGMIIQSGNDAAIALAEAIGGSEQLFAQMMNNQAQKFGMSNTHFVNATGLPDAQHYSAAEDLVKLSLALIRDFPNEFSYYKQKEFTYNKITQPNRNKLLWLDPSVDGLKTGFTEAAGYCIIATATRKIGSDAARRLIVVVLGTNSDAARAQEAQKLLNFGYQFFDAQRLYKKGEALATPEIYKGDQSTIKLGFDHDIWLTLPKDKFTGLKASLTTMQPLIAPYSAGQKAGVMKLAKDDKVIAELPVVTLENVGVASFLSRGYDTIRLLFK